MRRLYVCARARACVCECVSPQGRWGDAARKLSECLNDDTFRSLVGKSKHSLWLELCDLITKHPQEVQGIKVDAILRGGIRKFTDEVCVCVLCVCTRVFVRAPHRSSCLLPLCHVIAHVCVCVCVCMCVCAQVGRLWTSLADYYIRRAMFDKARDVYEEGMTSVMTVHDFSIVFDALTQFEESLLTAKMETLMDEDEVCACLRLCVCGGAYPTRAVPMCWYTYA